jgi:transketolase
LIGDGESTEGNIWEALAFSSFNKLDNLVMIIDVNRLGQSDPTMYEYDMDVYKNRVEAFGWNAIVIDGHDIKEIVDAFDKAMLSKGKPTCVIAKTTKGKFMDGMENTDNWHGKPLPRPKSGTIINNIKKKIKNEDKLGHEMLPINEPEYKLNNICFGETLKLSKQPSYKIGDQV